MYVRGKRKEKREEGKEEIGEMQDNWKKRKFGGAQNSSMIISVYMRIHVLREVYMFVRTHRRTNCFMHTQVDVRTQVCDNLSLLTKNKTTEQLKNKKSSNLKLCALYCIT